MIDWKKKLYASLTINNLLREEGVVYSKKNHSGLLEPFDGNSFDKLLPKEWF